MRPAQPDTGVRPNMLRRRDYALVDRLPRLPISAKTSPPPGNPMAVPDAAEDWKARISRTSDVFAPHRRLTGILIYRADTNTRSDAVRIPLNYDSRTCPCDRIGRLQ